MKLKLAKNQFVIAGLLFLLLGFAWPTISGTTPQVQFPQYLRNAELATYYFQPHSGATQDSYGADYRVPCFINYTVTVPVHSGSVTFFPTLALDMSNSTGTLRPDNYPTFKTPDVKIYLDGVKKTWSGVWGGLSFTVDIPAGDHILAVDGYTGNAPLVVAFTFGYNPSQYERSVLLKSFDAVGHDDGDISSIGGQDWSSGAFQVTVPAYQTGYGYFRMESAGINGQHRHVAMTVGSKTLGSWVSPNDQYVTLLFDDPGTGTKTVSISMAVNAPLQISVDSVTQLDNWRGTVQLFFDYIPTDAPTVVPPAVVPTPAPPVPLPPAVIPTPPTDGATLPTTPVTPLDPITLIAGGTDVVQWLLYAMGAVMIFLGFRRK